LTINSPEEPRVVLYLGATSVSSGNQCLKKTLLHKNWQFHITSR